MYPDELSVRNIGRLCDSMPDMPGCALQAACDKVRGRPVGLEISGSQRGLTRLGRSCGTARSPGGRVGLSSDQHLVQRTGWGCGVCVGMGSYGLAPAARAQGPSHVAARYCGPFTVLGTLCSDMPGMRGCEDYKALCFTAGSVVAQCADQPPVPGCGLRRTSKRSAWAACDSHSGPGDCRVPATALPL